MCSNLTMRHLCFFYKGEPLKENKEVYDNNIGTLFMNILLHIAVIYAITWTSLLALFSGQPIYENETQNQNRMVDLTCGNGFEYENVITR